MTGELQPTIRYSAFYKPAQSSVPSVYKDTVGLEKTLTISGLTPSTSYQVKVKALRSDSNVVSDSSPNFIATTGKNSAKKRRRQDEVLNEIKSFLKYKSSKTRKQSDTEDDIFDKMVSAELKILRE
ncbi:unnamed protein product [Clavelina lepadiformis]|uniref:Fibronectin type-III domain-containing protein n=1 Tax=Clavelina lepadiformis TaxID=159417 RepID=A0ABP0GBJ9_CLALP